MEGERRALDRQIVGAETGALFIMAGGGER